MKKGFTLLEVLIATFMFLLILGIIYSIYIFNHRSYVFGEDLAEVIQNGRVISERVARELRQAKKILSALPSERPGDSEIIFQDGHILPITASGFCQGGTTSSIMLSASSSSEDNYYKDLYVRITAGTGSGQIAKIYSYDGTSKTAQIEGAWASAPDISSQYKIDSSYYYIKYYKDTDEILRKVYTYCVSLDGSTCSSPETYVPYDFVPPPGQSAMLLELEAAKTIGEYVSNVEFWSSPSVITCLLTLDKNGRIINLEEKVFGRNL